MLRRGVVGRRLHSRIAYADLVDAIKRDVMLDDKIPSHALRHALRVRDSSGAASGGEALNLHDGSALILHLLSELIESFFGLGAQHLLSRTETDLGVGNWLILIQGADRLLHGGQLRAGLIDRLLCGLSAVAGIYCVLVGFIGLERCLLDAFLSASINVLDIFRILRGEFIELVHAIADRLHLALNVFLAGEGIKVSPEPFMRFLLQRLMR